MNMLIQSCFHPSNKYLFSYCLFIWTYPFTKYVIKWNHILKQVQWNVQWKVQNGNMGMAMTWHQTHTP
jgi:hypothetical protein